MYQKVGKVAYKADLSNIQKLDKHLKHPHHSFPSIHVAGTNGKGSTCHILASVLQEAGYKVGLYTSPHLRDFRERIKINGKPCEKQFVVDFISLNKDFFESNQLSFFEMTVGMAFQYFKERQVDIAIIEVGLGGRLDSTNIITPLISVITSIDKDHTAILGNTLPKIAMEKAGIIKPNVPVVVGERRSLLRSRFRESAQNINAPYHQVNHKLKAPVSDLSAWYQKDNLRTALTTLKLLDALYAFNIDENHIKKGCNKVSINTSFYGRYTKLSTHPLVIADTAHNVAGVKALMKQINKEQFDKLYIVIGMVSDKDALKVIKLLPPTAYFILTQATVSRAMPVEVLSKYFEELNRSFEVIDDVKTAKKVAIEKAQEGDAVIVTGSTFVVAEIF
ncbi:dihydrofolate synthase [Nonlabens tegetincola]|uniref:Dihydrofolate synthase/folylpolyglutamate synthase n=1 Tax=Nonlabens tegetincola TaxID=323273 RepID=A0A090Q799_9FLAO|nr:folylpolyglutamate synthase/dihydrofolate synthase family protein [Nonlabens tegetincola]GAK98067.1 dihydrofolate synthase [Nonlabens tegetincola]